MAAQSERNEEPEIEECTPVKMGIPEEIQEKTEKMLAPLEQEMYEDWRLEFARWAFDRGKDPEFTEGYPNTVMRQHLSRIEKFARWVWNDRGFTLEFSVDDADKYWNTEVKNNDNAWGSRRKTANSIAIIFRKKGIEWEIPNSKTVYEKVNKESGNSFTDWFTKGELERIKHASLTVYGVPDTDDMDAEERDEWASHLAQRLQKPKDDLTEDDWNTANSYKIPSLVYVSCDVGFRPKEVERSRWGWFDLDDKVMRIPKSESTKNTDHWHCYIGDQTTRLLKLWKKESYGDDEGPDPDDPIWLTKKNNPYSSDSLREPTMEKLMAEAGINQTGRETGWYMIRRGVGTQLGAKKGLSAVMSQLRITNVQTARRYVRHDAEELRDWLESR